MSEAGEKERRRNLRREIGEIAVKAIERVEAQYRDNDSRIRNLGRVLHGHIEEQKSAGHGRDKQLEELQELVVAAGKKLLALEAEQGQIHSLMARDRNDLEGQILDLRLRLLKAEMTDVRRLGFWRRVLFLLRPFRKDPNVPHHQR